MGNHVSRRYFLSLTAAYVLGSGLSACSGGQQKHYSSIARGGTVLALGDSLTAGYGAGVEAAYPAVLAQHTGWQVVNGGVSGDTSAQALARLPQLMHPKPQLVLVSIGGNDFLRKIPEHDTRAHIHQIIQTIQQAQIPLVLVAMPYLTAGALLGRLSDHPLYAALAQEWKIPLLAGAWADILGDRELKSDPIHANAQGYRVFAQKMWVFLQQQGLAA